MNWFDEFFRGDPNSNGEEELSEQGDQSVPDETASVGGSSGEPDTQKQQHQDCGDIDHAEWPKLEPLNYELLPVQQFDIAMLPNSIATWVEDCADSMQCPIDYLAAGAMGCISGAIGGCVAIQPNPFSDWVVQPTLWVMVVGRPGSMKSPAIAKALEPLKEIESEARDRYLKSLAEYKYLLAASDISIQAAETEAKAKAEDGDQEAAANLLRNSQAEVPLEPTQQRYTVHEPTVEALGEVLISNPFGVLVVRDEMSAFLKKMSSQGYEEARTFFLTGHDGVSEFSFDRIGRGYRYIPRVWLSFVGAIQPDVLKRFVSQVVNGGMSNDGLIQRFGMAVWPDPHREYKRRDRPPNLEAKRAAFLVINRLSKLRERFVNEDDGTPVTVLKFSDDGQNLFDDWFEQLELELRSGELSTPMEATLSKYRKLMPTIALLCAVADDRLEEVTEHDVRKAIHWCTYLRTHAERIYSVADQSIFDAAKTVVAKISSGHLKDGFTARDVYRPEWNRLKGKGVVRAALRLLVSRGYLREVAVEPATGRPTIRYLIHPELNTV